MDIEEILEMYEDDYNPRALVQGPRNMDQEPRIGLNDGGFLDEALAHYDNYLKSGGTIPFKKFFEEFSRENRAEGGVIGKPGGIVEHGVEYYGKSYKPGNPAYEAALERSRQLSENAPEGMKYDRKLKKYVKSKQKIRTKEINKIQENVLNFVNKKLKNKKYVSIPEIAKNVKDLNLKEGTLSPDKKSSAIIRRALENEKYRNKPILDLMGKQEYQDTRAAGFLRKAKTLVSDQEKILDLAMSGKYKTANEIKKATNLSAEKFEKELIKLYSNIYEERNRVNQGLKKFSVFLPRDEKQLKNILNVFADIDGFQGPETRSIFKLVRETYGKEGTNPNMKKYKQATSKLIDYYGTVKEIQKKHPTIKLDLEHPLDFKTIEGLGKKGEKFLHITPVSENLNRGLFKVIGTQYRSALESGDAKFIQNVEKLADDLGINIGKVKGKRIKDFGTSIIGESDFKKEIIENLKKQNVIADKVNPMQKSGELKKRLLEIGVKKPKDYNIEKINTDLLKLAGTANKKCKGLLSYGGRAGLAEGLSPEFCINEGKKVAQKALFEEGATPAQKSIARRLISTGGKIALSMLNPKELIRLSNLVGPGALGLMGLYEAGSITDDVLRLNKPLDEALAGNWLTKSFLPYSEEFAKQKNLLQSGQLTGDQKEYALEMMKMENFVKEGQRIEGMAATQLLDDSGYGNIDGSPMVSKEDMNKAYAGMFGRLTRMQPYIFEEGITGRGLENEAAMNEYQDSRLAKTGEYTSAISEDKFRLPGQRQIKQDENYDFASSPIFGGPQRMVNKAPRPKNMGRGPMTEKGRMNLDFSIPGYTPYDKAYNPSDEEVLQIYRNQGIVPATFGGKLQSGEGTKVRMGLASQGDNRSIYGSKFMEGGIASLNVNKK